MWGILNRCKCHHVATPDPGVVGALGKYLPPGPGVVAKKNLTHILVKRKFVLINLSTDLFRLMDIPENPQKSRECKLKNLRVGIFNLF